MAQTLPNGVVVPNEDGQEQISASGVQEMRTLGASADTALASKASTSYVDTEVDSARWGRGRFAEEASVTALAPGVYTIGTMTAVGRLSGLPENIQGTLTIEGEVGELVRSFTYSPYSRDYTYTMRTTTGGTTMPWVKHGATLNKGRLTAEVDAFTLDPGFYTISSLAAAERVANLPEDWPGTLIVEGNPGEGVKAVRFLPYSRDYSYETVAQNLSGDFMPWRKSGQTAFRGQDPGLMHKVQREMFVRRRGGRIGTGGLPVVALRWDHGLDHFESKILPHLKRLGLPGSMAMNSDKWDVSPTVTPAMLNSWAVDHGIEVWNHGQTHGDASTFTDLWREIVTGKEELQAQVPSTPVEGWIVPGVGGTGYGGFSAGQSAAHWDTVAGRLILAHHGASSSHMPGLTGPLAGDQAILGRQYSIDSESGASVRAEVDELVDAGMGGLIIFLHPSQLDGSGRISTTDYVSVLEHVASLRDQGRIAVLTMGGLSVADQDRVYRSKSSPLLPAMGAAAPLPVGGSVTRQRAIDARREWARGAVRELVVTVNATTAGTLTIRTGDAAATSFTVPVGVSVIRRGVTIPLAATSLAVTVESGTAAGQVTQIQDYPI